MLPVAPNLLFGKTIDNDTVLHRDVYLFENGAVADKNWKLLPPTVNDEYFVWSRDVYKLRDFDDTSKFKNYEIVELDGSTTYFNAVQYFGIQVYGHLWDTFQKLWYIKSAAPDAVLLGPKITDHVKNLDLHYRIFGYGPDRRCDWPHGKNIVYKVQRLLTRKLSAYPSRWDLNDILRVRDSYLEYFGRELIRVPDATDNLFLTRFQTRLVKNDTELRAGLERTGWTILDGTEGILRHIKAFSKAKIIVGVHGSLFKNILFCDNRNVSVKELCCSNRLDTTFVENARTVGISDYSQELRQSDANYSFSLTIDDVTNGLRPLILVSGHRKIKKNNIAIALWFNCPPEMDSRIFRPMLSGMLMNQSIDFFIITNEAKIFSEARHTDNIRIIEYNKHDLISRINSTFKIDIDDNIDDVEFGKNFLGAMKPYGNVLFDNIFSNYNMYGWMEFDIVLESGFDARVIRTFEDSSIFSVGNAVNSSTLQILRREDMFEKFLYANKYVLLNWFYNIKKPSLRYFDEVEPPLVKRNNLLCFRSMRDIYKKDRQSVCLGASGTMLIGNGHIVPKFPFSITWVKRFIRESIRLETPECQESIDFIKRITTSNVVWSLDKFFKTGNRELVDGTTISFSDQNLEYF